MVGLPRLVREGPNNQFFADQFPELGQTVRLNDQEEDDQATDRHDIQVLNRGRADRNSQGLG